MALNPEGLVQVAEALLRGRDNLAATSAGRRSLPALFAAILTPASMGLLALGAAIQSPLMMAAAVLPLGALLGLVAWRALVRPPRRRATGLGAALTSCALFVYFVLIAIPTDWIPSQDVAAVWLSLVVVAIAGLGAIVWGYTEGELDL
jgi:hypothetical protein